MHMKSNDQELQRLVSASGGNDFIQETNKIFEQRVKDVVAHYRKNTIIDEVKCTVVVESSLVYTMYATYFLPNSLKEITDMEIVVDHSNQYGSHLDISLCHELGHLENALQAVTMGNKRILEPTTWAQKLRVEIMADRKAAKIYGNSHGRNAVSQWLRDEMIHYAKNYKKALNKKDIADSFLLFLIRYISNFFSRQEHRTAWCWPSL